MMTPDSSLNNQAQRRTKDLEGNGINSGGTICILKKKKKHALKKV
jgi:hypothetical protein